MKLCTFMNSQGKECIGIVKGNKVFEMDGYKNMLALIRDYEADKVQKYIKQVKMEYSLEKVKLMPPVTNPQKMIFIGLNYRDHATETNTPIPDYPILFSKFPNSLIGHEGKVIIPKETKKCDYEAELAVIIGKRARNVRLEDALNYVFGYTALNDVSARDLQSQTSQWLRGKAIDTFAPLGPVLVSADEIKDPHNLDIRCRVNGTERQKSNTKEMIFNVAYLVSYISRTITLEPGDIISTGTPAGVALGMENPLWLKEGDICEVEIEGIGILRNTFSYEK